MTSGAHKWGKCTPAPIPSPPPVYLDKFNKSFYFAVIDDTAQAGNLIENFIVGQILALFAYWRVMGLKNR